MGILTAKMVVHRGHVGTGMVTDLGDAGVLESLGGKHRAGGVQQTLTGFNAVFTMGSHVTSRFKARLIILNEHLK
jgi:hypothetical protein